MSENTDRDNIFYDFLLSTRVVGLFVFRETLLWERERLTCFAGEIKKKKKSASGGVD